jgi:hypothetical protein
MLTVRREHDTAGVTRRMKILVDGEVAAQLSPGASVDLSLPSGAHEIQARMDWCSSEIVRLETGSSQRAELVVAFPFLVLFPGLLSTQGDNQDQRGLTEPPLSFWAWHGRRLPDQHRILN